VVTEKVAMERERTALLEREQEARAQAEHASRMKDDFLATLSHELRTPLNAIVGWTYLATSDGGTGDVRKALEVIDRNGKALTRLVGELLDASMMISGRMRLELELTDLVSLVGEVAEAVRPAAQAKRLRLLAVLDPEVGAVWADPGRLRQVVWNLLSNAVKFTPTGGEVKVLLGRAGAVARIVVTDSGPGIPQDFLPHIFERFSQSDSSSTRAHGGLGLGLAIARHLVEAHRGTISASSPGANLGATFTVELPLAQVLPTAVAGKEGAAQEWSGLRPELVGRRVLVVEDDADARDLATSILRQTGASALEAASAADALRSIAAAPPDVLLVDIGLPEEDGYTLLRQARARGFSGPAAAITAYASEADRKRALASGFQEHLSKPFDPPMLVDLIARLAAQTTA
jgi:CheY-like chemotaxis protein/nitrogen-specific signal transduction histidine kinase